MDHYLDGSIRMACFRSRGYNLALPFLEKCYFNVVLDSVSTSRRHDQLWYAGDEDAHKFYQIITFI